jgi:PHP domain
MTERYVELHAASAFSFLEGASQPEALIEQAASLEMPALAVLDRNGLYGAARFHTSGKRKNVRAHIGAEIAVSSLGSRLKPPAWVPHQHAAEPARLPLLCESREGYSLTMARASVDMRLLLRFSGFGGIRRDELLPPRGQNSWKGRWPVEVGDRSVAFRPGRVLNPK